MKIPPLVWVPGGCLFAVLITLACTTPGNLTPAVGRGTDYPCGVDGVVCPGAMCCQEEETCGGGFPSVGCPAGQCCFIGVGAERKDGGMGVFRQHPQIPTGNRGNPGFHTPPRSTASGL